LVRLLAEQVGLPASRVNYIAFSGGGAALAAVLGGQLSAAVSGYSEFAGQIASGQLRILAVSAPTRVDGIDAPSLRESGIGLDLANWRAVVAPPGLSDAEVTSLTARVTRMADSAEWTATLERFGWDDQFLAGAAFRQFLLAEQSRIEDLLRRLAATDAAGAPSLSVRVTPMTLPAGTIILLSIVMTAAIVTIRRAGLAIDRTGQRMLASVAAGLLALPILFVTAGFVAASTLLFAITASALRAHRPTARTVAVDLVAGAIFATALFLLFTHGLGLSLPASPLS
jgi:hypothetical protein